MARATSVSLRVARDYGYEGQAVLLQNVQAPDRLGSAPAQLSVEAQWLACQDICIPEHSVAQVTLRQDPLAARPRPPHRQRSLSLPLSACQSPPRGRASLAVDAASVVLRVHGIVRQLPSVAQAQFLPLTWARSTTPPNRESYGRGADLLLTLKRGDLRSSPIGTLDGILVLGPGSGKLQGQGYVLHAFASDAGEPLAR